MASVSHRTFQFHVPLFPENDLGNKHNEVSFPHEALNVSVSPPVLRKKIQRELYGQYDHTGRLKEMVSETDT